MDNIFLEQIVSKCKTFGGVTVNCQNNTILNLPDLWLFPKFPDKTKIINIDCDLYQEILYFYNLNRDLLDNNYLGIWLNKKTDQWYCDISTSTNNKKLAISEAIKINSKSKRQIESIYNPKRNVTIYLNNLV